MEKTLALATSSSSSSSSSSSPDGSERRRPPGPRPAPWLVFPYCRKGGKHQQAFYNLCEPNNKTCLKFIPELRQKPYWQKHSHQGWLVILCDDDKAEYSKFSNLKYGDCFMWNPVSCEKIRLPSLLYWLNKFEGFFIQDCVLSSPPNSITNPHDDDSTVFFLFERSNNEICEQRLVFCHVGKNKPWRKKKLPRVLLHANYLADDVVSLHRFKGKLYGMSRGTRHLEIERQLGDDDKETLSLKTFNVSDDDTFFPSILGELSEFQTCYIESSDELFKIVLNYNPRAKKVVTMIELLRLDFSLMAWERVKSLGDHVLFLANNTRSSCSAAELGLTRGCLYYTLPEDKGLYKFEVEDNAITPIFPCPKLPTLPRYSAEWMMMPISVMRDADERQRTKDDEEGNIIKVEENGTSIINDEKENQEKKQNGGELQEAGTWVILNKDIVELIATYLHPVDYGNFRAVCKANQLIIPARYQKYSINGIKTTIPSSSSPWLVFPKDNDTIYNFVDPMHNNEKYLMNISELLIDAKIRFSKGGWLLLSKGVNNTIFFYNPFTKATIQLPDLQETFSFIGMSFSSLPTCSDCVVFGIDLGIDLDNLHRISIFSIARGNDSWRSSIFEVFDIEKYTPCYNNPILFDGAFYCLDYKGTLGVFSLKDDFNWSVLANPQECFKDVYPSFLVECEGSLLLVDLGPLGKSIGIFRLDFSKMVWVKVENLGKHMLFISYTSCLSAVAPDSRMENKIYFPRLHGQGILFYSLDTGMYHSVGSQHSVKDFYDTKELLNCTWIEPNWPPTTKQELDWLSI